MTAKPKTTAPSMEIRKRVALVAHDNKKEDLLDWASSHLMAETYGGAPSRTKASPPAPAE